MSQISDRDLLLIFGTETGNAEELAEDAAGLAKNYDLNPNVMDMEDINPVSYTHLTLPTNREV